MSKIHFKTDNKDVRTIMGYVDKQYLTVGAHLQSLLMESETIKDPRPYMDAQRGYTWEKWRASNLIHSLILQNRIPEITTYRHDDRSQFRKVLDGQQRITTMYLFINNKLALDMSRSIFPIFIVEDKTYTAYGRSSW